MSDQQTVLTQRIVEEVWRAGEDADIARIVFDVLMRSGIDVRREPSLEEMKQILVSVYRAANQSLFRTPVPESASNASNCSFNSTPCGAE